jgi:hypothetical protein
MYSGPGRLETVHLQGRPMGDVHAYIYTPIYG